jgi:hypothetical protein
MKKKLILLFCLFVMSLHSAWALSLSVTTEDSYPGCSNGKIHILISSPCGGAYKVGGGFFPNGVLTYEVGPGTYSYTFFDDCCLLTDASGNCLSVQNDVQTITATISEIPCEVVSGVEVLQQAGPFLCNQGQVRVTTESNSCGIIWTHLLRNGISYDVHLNTSPGTDTFLFSNLYAGSYAMVSYTNFCQDDTLYFTITEDKCDIDVNILNTFTVTGSPLCNNGSITFESVSPSCQITYHNSLLFQNNIQMPFTEYYYPGSSPITYSSLAPGEYRVVVSLGGFCTDTSSSITVVSGPCDFEISMDSLYQLNTVCNSGKAFFHLNTNACNLFVTNLYRDGIHVGGLNTIQGANYSFENLYDGNYVLISTDGFCSDTAYFSMNPCTNSNYSIRAFLQSYYGYAGYMWPVIFQQGQANYPVFTDSIEVQFREAASPASTAFQTKALLQLNGNISLELPAFLMNQSYYIVLKNRQAIETWSANPVTISVNGFYDFSIHPNQAFGANQTQIEPGLWALYSGDINQDGVVDGLDYNEWENDSNNFVGGYFSTDLNGDGIVDGLDFIYWEMNSNNFVGAAVP